MDELVGEINRLGRLAGSIAGEQLDGAPQNAAPLVNLVDGKLHALVLGDGRRRQRPGERRKPADFDRLLALRMGHAERDQSREAEGGKNSDATDECEHGYS